MGDVIDELLARDDIGTNGPAARSEIDAVSRYFDAPLPELLVKLWRASDGVTLEQLDAHLLGPSEVRQLLADGAWNEELVERGFLPVLDDHQSNYLVVIVRDPLAFRVAHVPHDDGSRLLYRDFESCIADLLRAMDGEDSADLYLHDAQGDYTPDAPRPGGRSGRGARTDAHGGRTGRVELRGPVVGRIESAGMGEAPGDGSFRAP
jgi:hypothetical protein